MAKPASGLDAYTPFGVAARITIERLSVQMMVNLPGTRSGEDIEALHDMRVASRRLRAALRVFCKCFPKTTFRAVVPEIQRITRALGTVRDIDVFLEFLAAYAETSGIDVSELAVREEALRDAARQQMFLSLDELECGSLPQLMNAMLHSARMVDLESASGLKNHFFAQAPSLIAPPLKELLDLSPAIEDLSKVSELHQMRIAAKRLRYSMETFVPCFGQPLIDKINEVKLLQEHLGQIHDCDVWVDKLLAYRAEDGLTSKQLSLIDGIISERIAHRDMMYAEVLVHWHRLCDEGFARQLVLLVNSEPVIQNQTIKGVAKMEQGVNTESLNTEEQPVETPNADSTPGAKPVRKRTTKVAKPAETDTEKVGESTPVAKPARKSTKAKKVSGNGEAEPAPTEPQHPRIVELKELVQTTTSHMTADNTLTPKMAKQLSKAETMLELLPAKLRYVTLKDAAKAERWMSDLKRQLISITEEGKLSGKKTERIRDKIKSMRKKLSNVSPIKGKKK